MGSAHSILFEFFYQLLTNYRLDYAGQMVLLSDRFWVICTHGDSLINA